MKVAYENESFSHPRPYAAYELTLKIYFWKERRSTFLRKKVLVGA
jgi:hypothetical protein